MAYYPDLSSFDYTLDDGPVSGLNVGWLDDRHPYTTGAVSELFLARLWEYCRNSVLQMRGFHTCELCDAPSFMHVVQRNDETLHLGSAQILVTSSRGITYTAPDLIYHYVVDHQYQPPQAFVEAVETAPLPFELWARPAL